MDLVSEFIHNPLMQSLFLGPLMGVLFAALFSGFNSSPEPEAPATVVQTRTIYITKVIDKRQSSKRSDDGMSLLIIGGIALIFVIWKYAIYFNTILYYLNSSILTVLSFSVTTILISLIKGQYTSNEWWLYTLVPLLFLFISLYLLNLAKVSFDPAIQQGALNNNLWEFYTDWLDAYGRNFMLAHVGGVAILALAVLFTAFLLIHYLSLMNQRSSGMMHKLWFFLAKHTSFFAGKSCAIFISFLLATAYVLINPELAATWMTNK
ncbi:hypothetical protein [Vibrio caribbeanicus]|uniref:hypothetical protein n=1 Tax=Vibrio caribbeanicus TaxID=701175 RepID=UPI00228345E4|nr:hypothetical protein [Vibrio caribbeanicus]MCY9845750.1 hypothetical protein [Vibrio caribbeanicus]